MKSIRLIILTILLITSTYNFTDFISFDTPSIKIKDVSVIESYRGKVICYTINIYSPSRIKDFIAKPSIAGANSDSETKYEFTEHTRKATVIYYYAIPNDLDEDIDIKFCLNDDLKLTDCINRSKM